MSSGTPVRTPRLFEPLRLRSRTLPNRLVVAPMCQYSAVDGCARPWHTVHLGSFAAGGFGLVIAEATAVHPDGRITPQCLGLWSERQESALAEVVRQVRAVAPAMLGIQIAHAGRKAGHYRPFVGERKGPVPHDQGGWQAIGPSAIPFGAGPMPRELREDELPGVLDHFAAAAARAARLDFDYLEVHAAHGYLLASFLSPLSNARRDRYGGSLEARMRFPLEVVERVRAVWPSDRPLGVRFGGSDWCEDGWTIEDACAFARELAARGVDVLHVSTAGNAPVKPETAPGWLVPHARAVREASGAAVFAVGELDDPALAERILTEGSADAVAIARGALRDPRFPWRAARELGCPPPFVAPYAWAVGR